MKIKIVAILVTFALLSSALYSSSAAEEENDDTSVIPVYPSDGIVDACEGPYTYTIIPEAHGDYVGYVNQPILFEGSVNRPNLICDGRWDFNGDGIYDTPWMRLDATGHIEVEHTFTQVLSSTVTFQIKRGGITLIDTAELYIIDGDDWPFIHANFTYNVETAVELPPDEPDLKYVTVNFDSSASFSDYMINNNKYGILYFKWIFGDGTTETRWKSMSHKYPDGYEYISHSYAVPRDIPDDYVLLYNVELIVGIHDWQGNDLTESLSRSIILQPLDIEELNIEFVPVIEVSYLAKLKGEDDSQYRKNIDAVIGDTIEWKVNVEHVGDQVDFSDVGDRVWVLEDNWKQPFMPLMKTILPCNLLDIRNGTITGVGTDFEDSFAEYSFVELGDNNMLIPLKDEIFEFLHPAIDSSFPYPAGNVPLELRSVFAGNGIILSDNAKIKRIDDNELGHGYIEWEIYDDIQGPYPGEYTRYYMRWWSGWPGTVYYDHDDNPETPQIPLPGSESAGDYVTVYKYRNGYPESLRYPNTGATTSSNSWGIFWPADWTNQYNSDYAINPGDKIEITFETTATAFSKDNEVVNETKTNEFVANVRFSAPYLWGPLIPFSVDPDEDLPYDKFIVMDTWAIDEVSVNVAPVRVEKFVKDDGHYPEEPYWWVKSAELLPDDEAEFKCEIKSSPNILLEKGLQIVDYVPYNMEYVETESIEIKIDLGDGSPIQSSTLEDPNDYDVSVINDKIIWTINKGFNTLVGIAFDPDDRIKCDVFTEVIIEYKLDIAGVGFCLNKAGLEDFNMIVPYYAKITGDNDLPDYYTYSGEGIYDTTLVRVTGEPTPGMDINLKAWSPGTNQWVEEQYTGELGSNARFNITVTNTGNISLKDIKVILTLCDLFTEEDNLNLKNVELYIDSLNPDKSHSFEIEAEILKLGQGTNTLNVNATYLITEWMSGASEGLEERYLNQNAAIRVVSVEDLPINPTAVDDSAETYKDVAVLIDILSNDFDDEFVDPSTVTITNDPKNGEILEINSSNGKVTYLGNCDFTGIDSFKYTVKDNEGLTSNEASVTITVKSDDPPVPPPDPDINITITKPVQNMIYIRNQSKMPFLITLLLGKTSIEANITGDTTNITDVKFFLDNQEIKNIEFIDTKEQYQCMLTNAFGYKTIKVAAYKEDTELESTEIDVIAIIFSFSI